MGVVLHGEERKKMKLKNCNLKECLQQKQKVILNRWFETILELYPPETAKFLKQEENQFANPVGTAFYRQAAGLYEGLARGAATGELHSILEELIKIKAVYDSSPSQAIAFIFKLKDVVRDQLGKEISEGYVSETELQEMDKWLDELALLAFDKYMEAREQIYQAKVNEIKRKYHMVQRLSNACG